MFGEDAVNRGNVRKWCRLFEESKCNVHDEKRSGPPSVVTDNLTGRVNQKSGKSGVSQIITYTNLFFFRPGFERCPRDKTDGVVQCAGPAERLGSHLFDRDTQKLVPRYDKYLNLHGDCVQWQFNVRTNMLQQRYFLKII